MLSKEEAYFRQVFGRELDVRCCVAFGAGCPAGSVGYESFEGEAWVLHPWQLSRRRRAQLISDTLHPAPEHFAQRACKRGNAL